MIFGSAMRPASKSTLARPVLFVNTNGYAKSVKSESHRKPQSPHSSGWARRAVASRHKGRLQRHRSLSTILPGHFRLKLLDKFVTNLLVSARPSVSLNP